MAVQVTRKASTFALSTCTEAPKACRLSWGCGRRNLPVYPHCFALFTCRMCKHSMWSNTRCSTWRDFIDHIHLSMLFSEQQPAPFIGHNNLNLPPKVPPVPSVLRETPPLLWHFPLLAEEHHEASSHFFRWFWSNGPDGSRSSESHRFFSPDFKASTDRASRSTSLPDPQLVPLTQRGHHAHPTGASAHLAFPSWNVPILAELLP